MAKKKFTDAAVRRFPVPKNGRTEYWDSLTPGFGLRVTSKGRRSWVLMTRVHDEKNASRTLARFTLGTYPSMGLAEARKSAAAKLDATSKDAAAGIDTRAAARKVPPRKKNRAIEDAVSEFFRLYVSPNLRESTAEQYRIAWYVHTLPRWLDHTIDDIKRSDVIDLLDEIVAEGKPIAANRTLAVVRKFFAWAAPRYDLDAVPTVGVAPPTNEKARERERVLTDQEIVSLWQATGELGWPFAPFVRMLLVTAQRRSEVASMKWHEVDLENALWTIPASQNKANRNHEVPLSSLALEILESLPRLGTYVFTTLGDRPLSGFSRAKRRLDRAMEIEDWRLHDLRRTAGTNMASLRIAPSTISRVLNHAEGGVTRIYVRYAYGQEKREAMDIWGQRLKTIINRKIIPNTM